jgi:peptidoglycan/LPS O-acetylase OafA/YrhL
LLRYRPDIDGLRSLAIVPILLFHAGVNVLRGGYIGVDVFFLISGFLITQIILHDVESGHFTILKFYQRRVARILPALFVVLAVVGALAAPVLVLPNDISAVFRNIAAAAGFVSNLYLWWQVDYFAAAAESQPLLHTWSLGVEEQFYIFFPLLLVALRNAGRRTLVLVLIGIAIASFVAGALIQPQSPQTDFYMLPTRAWELVLGGLVGIGVLPKLSDRWKTLAALFGVALVGCGTLVLATWLPFPTPFALVPAVGTALILGYGETTIVGRAFSWRPVRWIGQISYSLYLWHWPVITYYRQLTGDDLSLVETAGLVGVSIVLAAISYYAIELPAQRLLRRMPPGRAVAVGAVGVVGFIAAGLAIAGAAPRIWAVPAAAERVASYSGYNDMPHDDAWDETMACFVESRGQTLNTSLCLKPDAAKRNVVLLGDSHANMYGPPLRRLYPDLNVMQATYFGCPPLAKGSRDWRCQSMIDNVIGPLASSGKVQSIVMASRWRANQAARLGDTVRMLRAKGIDVTVIGPVPEYQGSYPSLLARAMVAGDPGRVRAFESHDRRDVDAMIRKAAESNGARYVSAYDTLCPGGQCLLTVGKGEPVHFDYGHLTDPAADLVVRKLPRP